MTKPSPTDRPEKPHDRATTPLLRRIGRATASGVVLAVALVVVLVMPTAPAAPPAKPPQQPRRFFEAFIPRSAPPPRFIPLPEPPPAVAEPSEKKTSKGMEHVPSWSEASAFTSSVAVAVQKAARDAVSPGVPQKKPAINGPSNPYAVKKPSGPPPPKTRRLMALRTQIARTLATYQRRPLNTAQHSPWEVMHGFIAFGIPTNVRVGGPGGDLVNAIGWMNMGGRCHGQVMLVASGDRLTALQGVGVQGHSAQYLAILAQCRVSKNSPITVQSKTFTLADLIEEEKLACRSGTELTFALIAMAHYLPSDATWTSREGEKWSLPRLVEEEIAQPVRGAACGGTHRLFGLSYGCQRRLKATGALDGVYLRADKYVRDYQNLALKKLQNRDGSFSTEWFKYPADREDDIDRKVQTTGHILEWLVSSLDQERLYESRVVAAAEFLAAALASEPSREWKIGPLGHALHALTIYQERVWGVVLPGGIAAYHGPMKAGAPVSVADRPSKAPGTRISR
ncbi:MAG: hypothetical protein ACKOYJ_04845 [Planctomycetia bacterium]